MRDYYPANYNVKTDHMRNINGIHAIFLLAAATTQEEFKKAHTALAYAHSHGFTDPTTKQPADLDQYGTVISAYADWAADTCHNEDRFKAGIEPLVNITPLNPRFIDSVMAGLSYATIGMRGLRQARVNRAIQDLSSERGKLGAEQNIFPINLYI